MSTVIVYKENDIIHMIADTQMTAGNTKYNYTSLESLVIRRIYKYIRIEVIKNR